MHGLLYVCDTCRGRALAHHFSSLPFGVAHHWPRSGEAMSDVTAIEWTDHTFNPWWGCSRVSPACRFCYADRDAQRYGHQVWRRHGPRRMLSEANWQRPLRWNRDAERAGIPAKVFCASMADVFEDHPDVAAPRERLWGVIETTPWLIWQLLSKRPENIARMVPVGRRMAAPRLGGHQRGEPALCR
jgi:protein gp37